MKIAIAGVVLCASMSGPLRAASFDCNSAQTPVERQICASEVVSKLDSELARIYSDKHRELPASQARRLVDEQRAWLANERAKCTDEKCLIVAYGSRLTRLAVDPLRGLEPVAIRDEKAVEPTYRQALVRDCDEHAKSLPEDGDLMSADDHGGARDDLEQVILACGQVVEVDRTNSRAFLYRGMAKVALSDLDAITDLTRAIALNDHDARPYLIRGEYLAINDDEAVLRSRAIADFTSAIALSPTSARAYFLRGDAFTSLALYSTYDPPCAGYAVADYSRVLELEPSNVEALRRRGFSASLMDDHPQVVKDFTTLIGIDPAEASYYQSRGEAFAKLGSRQQAAADFAKAIELQPTNPSAYEARGELRLQSGEFQPAIDDFSAALTQAPDHFNAYYSRGLARAKLGDKQRALDDWNVAASKGDYRARDALRTWDWNSSGNVDH